MREVARHSVGGQQVAQALEDIHGRTFGHWDELYDDRLTLEGLQRMGDDLLDHVAATTLTDPELSTASARTALRTAAECALGVLDLGAFPDGDFEVPLPLIHQTFSSDDPRFAFWKADQAPTARTWLDAFAMCVVSGTVWERSRVIGLLLRNDHAPAIHRGVPYSRLESHSDPAELAEMDALCGYLSRSEGPFPGDSPSVALCVPAPDERAEAVRQLDALSTLTPEQRLLRVLLDGDQAAFEQALAERLVRYRENTAADAAPRSLLPVGTLALAALAVQVHGWELRVRSGYLPEGLLRAPKNTPLP